MTGEVAGDRHPHLAATPWPAEDARTPVDSPAQSVVFGVLGKRRDFYYVSLSTVARVTFHDADV